MLKCVGLLEELSEEYFYCGGGILLINAALPAERILEIIKEHLDLK